MQSVTTGDTTTSNRAVGALFLTLAFATGCVHRAPGVAPAPSCYASLPPGSAPDSLRGIVALSGSEPGLLVMLTTPQGRFAELMIDRRLAWSLVGVEVSAYGALRRVQGYERMNVARLVVRALGDERAYDGILRRGPDGDQLLTCEGTLRLGPPLVPITEVSGDRIVVLNPSRPELVHKLPAGLP